ncbi:probable signal peptide protein [Geminocystis sp. NIES-3709]|nr:probable signal peptide protein [Geminocystis sp. NIES-3709]
MTTTDINKLDRVGISTFITEQLNSKNIDISANLTDKINEYQGLKMNVSDIFKNYYVKYLLSDEGKESLSDKQKKYIKQERRKFFNETLDLKIYKSVNNPRQLEELMTDFWFNHFNVFANKLPNYQRFLIHNYETQAIQAHALGKFRDLLQATAQHPSMLYYLDNWQNVSPRDKKSSKGLNENYARELMELHTLGVNGGYTQEDVISLARILTGWGIMNQKTPQNENGFYFFESLHDYGDKNFLGHTIKGSGIEEVYQALDILAYHPSTANYISYKLTQFFVADNPPNSLVKKLAKTFLDTQGDIKIVLGKLFDSEEFWDSKYYGNKFKTPYQYVISLLRIRNIENPPLTSTMATLRDLAMSPYNCVTPDGYKNIQSAWLSPDAMIKRVNFATNISSGKNEKINNNSQVNPRTFFKNFTDFFSSKTIELIKNTDQKWQSALILGSPEMMYK